MKNAWTIRSPRGLIASSGILRKSSRLNKNTVLDTLTPGKYKGRNKHQEEINSSYLNY